MRLQDLPRGAERIAELARVRDTIVRSVFYTDEIKAAARAVFEAASAAGSVDAFEAAEGAMQTLEGQVNGWGKAAFVITFFGLGYGIVKAIHWSSR